MNGKWLIMMAAVIVTAGLSAQEKSLNVTTRLKNGKPCYWALNESVCKGSKLEIDAASGKESFIRIDGGSPYGQAYYVNGTVPIKDGDKISLVYKVRGSGDFIYGYYSYDYKNSFSNNVARRKPLTAEWAEVKDTFEIIRPQGKAGTAFIRPTIGVSGKGKVEILSIQYTITQKKQTAVEVPDF